MKVIICGGGIVSACIAHSLLESGDTCVIIEKHEIGCAASGKAGGFLAKDWCENGPLEKFSRISFNLHEKLAASMNGKDTYDYRRLKAFSLDICPEKSKNKKNTTSSSWIDGCAVDSKDMRQIGSPDTIAQLHPYKFVQVLTKNNIEKGATVLEGEEVCGLLMNNDVANGAILSSGKTITGDAIVIAMGPWSGKASQWWRSIPSVYGQKAHSITVKPATPVPAEALFTEFNQYSPEFYPRPDGEIYICGMAEKSIPSNLLSPSTNVTVTSGSCEKIKEIADMVSCSIKNGEVTCSQACYLPLTHDGLPLIGKLNGVAGLYIAAGHGCWGILNSPATGKAMAELIKTGTSEIDIHSFNPNRFSA